MEGLLFYILAAFILVFSLAVIVVANPIFSALFLVLSMISLAFMFFLLQAYFIATVQLIVYAGAVMVLFLMVLMLFDLKKEIDIFSSGQRLGGLKIASAGLLTGLLLWSIHYSIGLFQLQPEKVLDAQGQMEQTKTLSVILFTKYLFAFEALGFLLLLIAIGVVALSRIKGGTHARD
ncbi:MAG: NADH-quinone oxidoreductase subunit J [Bdellovibrio sp.]|nr:MAG: NADH-quinone oxidoreductase subunit J [Bdellovibrio sp.]